MRVRCIATVPTDKQAAQLGARFVAGKTEYPIQVGTEYTVLGIGFWEGVVWLEIAASMRTLVSIPALLFEITSGRPSRHWEIRMHDNTGGIVLWPHSFFHPYYHDHLSDGKTDAIDDFKHLFSLLEAEAEG